MACTASKSSSGDMSMPGNGVGGGGAGQDLSSSKSPGHDLANSASQDLAMSGGGGGGGGDMAMVCSASSECPNATPVCCSRISLVGGTVPNCTPGAVKTDCETSMACPTTLSASCTGSQVVRLCKANSDCTEATNNQCCKFTSGGAVIHFCANSTLAGLGGGTCM
jgi:hypothetical protein